MGRHWENTTAYKKIMEILDDYWLCESNEKKVEVTLRFLHEDGRYQEKRIRWINPKYEKDYPAKIVSVADVLNGNHKDVFWEDEINEGI